MGIFSVDIIVFSVITLVYLKVKNLRPDWFFPPAGLTFFLPPEEGDLKELRQDKELSQKKLNSFQKKKFSKKPTLPLKMMQANSVHMQSLPFSAELELTMMFFIIITGHLLITQALKYIFDVRIDSNFVFYLNLIIFFMVISNVFKIITINGLQFSIHKLYIYCSLIYVFILLFLFFGFREFLYFNFEKEFQKLNVHLTNLLSEIYDNQHINLSFELFLIVSIVFSGLFVFILLPSIARFGDNYVKVLEQYYILDEKEKKKSGSANKTGEVPAEDPRESLEKRKKTMEQHGKIRSILNLFNLRLILNLLVLFFWVKPMMLPWVSVLGSEETISTMRVLFCLSYTVLIAYAYKYEIEMHFNKIYETLKTLLSDPGNENFRKVQARVSNLLQTSLMVSYIIVSKFIIPLIILYVMIYKSNYATVKYGNASSNLLLFKNYQKYLNNPHLPLSKSQKNELIIYASDWNCLITRNVNEIIWQVSTCPTNQKVEIKKFGTGYGVYKPQEEQNQGDLLKLTKELMRKINLYGLIPEEFHLNVLSFWLFNYFLANYFLSVFYIIFLRHSSNV